MVRIGVDVMGGTRSPMDIVKHLRGNITVFASKEVSLHTPLECVVCPETIEMDDDPLVAIRKKRNSSMICGIEALKNGQIDALVSLGNTGALTAACKIILGSQIKKERPALLTLVPTTAGYVAVTDVGASIDSSPRRYIELASMGKRFLKARGHEKIRFGLLNIGVEESKGRREMREALTLLSKDPNFVGNIESEDVFNGKVDLLLTDGFTGNIFLKTTEGLATFLLELFASHMGAASGPVVENINKHLMQNHYSAAMMLGVKGLVMKCHGRANAAEINHAIQWINSMSHVTGGQSLTS